MKIRLGILIMVVLCSSLIMGWTQNPTAEDRARDSLRTYMGGEDYPVANYVRDFDSDIPKNIILMIGDGMGLTQVFAGWVGNKGKLFLENFKHLGLSLTQALNRFTTDSAAGATALSTGKSTYNSAIGMVVTATGDTVAAPTLVEVAEEKGMVTGIVASSALSHATPASFVAHQKRRNLYDAIGLEYVDSGLEVMMGGGTKNFNDRADGQNLIPELEKRSYQVFHKMEEVVGTDANKIALITSYAQPLPYPDRDLDLPVCTEIAVNTLDGYDAGFFLMVEGSQIDWGAHNNITPYVVQEMMDFDRAIGRALKFAYEDGETLIVVTADHETGGMTIAGGNIEEGTVSADYSTGGHTGVWVPVFAYGPGADQFTGIIKNTEIGQRLMEMVKNR